MRIATKKLLTNLIRLEISSWCGYFLENKLQQGLVAQEKNVELFLQIIQIFYKISVQTYAYLTFAPLTLFFNWAKNEKFFSFICHLSAFSMWLEFVIFFYIWFFLLFFVSIWFIIESGLFVFIERVEFSVSSFPVLCAKAAKNINAWWLCFIAKIVTIFNQL